ncbi:M23 family metallopeptidase [Ideonella sp. 4Y11]|uniref:M23 family metallopeptidase n=1 Tax=Ideonella aquatica TaxID=2824119 RepID=A0A940YQ22_9BURK|nr:M23 family metallopeptidase [Ideonella aquatica]MBQ0957385.1 M23 family metallopeptidase [Ideonella aquatica]
MQILITGEGASRTRAFQLSRLQIASAVAALLMALLLLSGTIYHFIFLAAAREGWPVVSQIVQLVVRDEFAQRDRFMRENLDAMASKVGDMQARMIRLEAMGDRLTNLAGVKPDELRLLQPAASGASAPMLPAPRGAGGPYLPLDHPSLEVLNEAMSQLEHRVEQHADVFTLTESRLFEKRLASLMLPSSRPIDAPIGSPFGFRADPFTGRPALHTGQDFQASPGTPILSAAGGVVTSTAWHPQYGQLLEIDHGNGLATRYAHTSKILVNTGDIVKRGQQVALVGNTGRSTGPHLHFEVLIDGVPQNPSRFLAAAGP